MKTEIEATIIEIEKKDFKWNITNHKSIPKLVKWIERSEMKIIVSQDKRTVVTINKDDFTIIFWRIK